ncbi:hypothetical protein JXE04_03560 [Patescibacteria group bacterium]|nr:hypothetical protein [Patescibacteria group bacterium]
MGKDRVNAVYEEVVIYENVLINYPGRKDEMMHFVKGHSFVDSEGQVIKVPSHYKKDFSFDGQMLTVNYYIDPGLRGCKVVVDEVKIMEKTDYFRGGQKTIIIDTLLKKVGVSDLVPKSRLVIGSPRGKISIPGAPHHFIDFRKLKLINV